MQQKFSVRVSDQSLLDEKPGDDEEVMTEDDWTKASEEAINLAVAAVRRVRLICQALADQLQVSEVRLALLRVSREGRSPAMLADMARDLPASAIFMVVSNHTADDEIISHVTKEVTQDILLARVTLEKLITSTVFALAEAEAQSN